VLHPASVACSGSVVAASAGNHGQTAFDVAAAGPVAAGASARSPRAGSPRARSNTGDGDPAPDLSLIAVVPMRGSYWDTKHNPMVQLAKIAIGALTGTTMDDGVMGQLAP
jgi:hypothetical protein